MSPFLTLRSQDSDKIAWCHCTMVLASRLGLQAVPTGLSLRLRTTDVKLPKINLEETQPGSATVSPRTWWNAVLTATPIILTILATVLAGLSSRELTLSQYHRALAAQNQSKAGDQWNFFQAKRSRRTNHENTADLLQARAESGKAEAAALEASATFFRER